MTDNLSVKQLETICEMCGGNMSPYILEMVKSLSAHKVKNCIVTEPQSMSMDICHVDNFNSACVEQLRQFLKNLAMDDKLLSSYREQYDQHNICYGCNTEAHFMCPNNCPFNGEKCKSCTKLNGYECVCKPLFDVNGMRIH